MPSASSSLLLPSPGDSGAEPLITPVPSFTEQDSVSIPEGTHTHAHTHIVPFVIMRRFIDVIHSLAADPNSMTLWSQIIMNSVFACFQMCLTDTCWAPLTARWRRNPPWKQFLPTSSLVTATTPSPSHCKLCGHPVPAWVVTKVCVEQENLWRNWNLHWKLGQNLPLILLNLILASDEFFWFGTWVFYKIYYFMCHFFYYNIWFFLHVCLKEGVQHQFYFEISW